MKLLGRYSTGDRVLLVESKTRKAATVMGVRRRKHMRRYDVRLDSGEWELAVGARSLRKLREKPPRPSVPTPESKATKRVRTRRAVDVVVTPAAPPVETVALEHILEPDVIAEEDAVAPAAAIADTAGPAQEAPLALTEPTDAPEVVVDALPPAEPAKPPRKRRGPAPTIGREHVVTVRITASMKERIEKLVERQRARRQRGAIISTSTMLRDLIELGLAEAERDAG